MCTFNFYHDIKINKLDYEKKSSVSSRTPATKYNTNYNRK